MPSLDVSELNIVLSVLGAFTLLYGVISIKIKRVWYLGEARMRPPVVGKKIIKLEDKDVN